MFNKVINLPTSYLCQKKRLWKEIMEEISTSSSSRSNLSLFWCVLETSQVIFVLEILKVKPKATSSLGLLGQ